MKRGAYLVNTARGVAWWTRRLSTRPSTSGQLAGAGWTCSARAADGSPPPRLDSVVLSPHCAGTNATSEAAVANRCIDSIVAFAPAEWGPSRSTS